MQRGQRDTFNETARIPCSKIMMMLSCRPCLNDLECLIQLKDFSLTKAFGAGISSESGTEARNKDRHLLRQLASGCLQLKDLEVYRAFSQLSNNNHVLHKT